MIIVTGQNRFFVDEDGKVKDLTDTNAGLVARLRYFEQYGILDEMPGTEELGKAANAIEELQTVLTALLERYTGLVNCGDCGNWDCETEDEVISARAALAQVQS